MSVVVVMERETPMGGSGRPAEENNKSVLVAEDEFAFVVVGDNEEEEEAVVIVLEKGAARCVSAGRAEALLAPGDAVEAACATAASEGSINGQPHTPNHTNKRSAPDLVDSVYGLMVLYGTRTGLKLEN